jgi:hypothetical protein
MDMLRKDNKYGIAVLLIMGFLSCGEKAQEKYYDFNIQETQLIRNSIEDTVRNWVSLDLAIIKQLKFHSWEVDELVVLNNDSTLLFTTINNKLTGHKGAEVDVIIDFGGARIIDKWYFYFMGISMPVSRTLYKESKYTPYTFEELSFIAHKHRFPQVIKWNVNGSYTVKDQYFEDNFIKPVETECLIEKNKRTCFDSVIVELNKEYHKYKIDPEELAEIKETMAKSIKPDVIISEQKRITWWKRLWGNEDNVKLFESQEWKDYQKRKYEDQGH